MRDLNSLNRRPQQKEDNENERQPICWIKHIVCRNAKKRDKKKRLGVRKKGKRKEDAVKQQIT
jgi:hypothetical protein